MKGLTFLYVCRSRRDDLFFSFFLYLFIACLWWSKLNLFVSVKGPPINHVNLIKTIINFVQLLFLLFRSFFL